MDYFKISQNRSNIKTEIIAGFSTFLAMVYIIFVNPLILSSAVIEFGTAFTATCITAALGSFLVGLLANYPIAVAPGMGLNIYLSYIVVRQLGFSPETAFGMVFISGILFFIFTITTLREKLIRSIPHTLAIGITSGIGLLILVVALKNAQLLNYQPGSLPVFLNPPMFKILLIVIGFLLLLLLTVKKVPGAILISILMIVLMSALLGKINFQGIVSLPPPIRLAFKPVHLLEIFHQTGFFIIITFFLVALFDSVGTLLGLLEQPHFKNDPQKTRRLSRALLSDSLATICGSLLGTSTTSPYIESAVGISTGGRTGLTAIVVGFLFLLALVFGPLVRSIPDYASIPALFFVAYLMLQHLKQLKGKEVTDVIPALSACLAIPLRLSIADGVGIGIIVYVVMKLLFKRWEDLNMVLWILTLLFTAYFFVQYIIY